MLVAVSLELCLLTFGLKLGQLRLLLKMLRSRVTFKSCDVASAAFTWYSASTAASSSSGLLKLKEDRIGLDVSPAWARKLFNTAVVHSRQEEDFLRNEYAQPAHVPQHRSALYGIRPQNAALPRTAPLVSDGKAPPRLS